MATQPCATDDDLAALAVGTLTPTAADDLLAHLDSCPRCSSRAGEFDDRTDDVVLGVRQVGPPLAEPPRAVGEYDLLGPLGSGGMGRVYRARHRRLDRLVALKFLAPAAAGWPNARDRFAREVRLTAGLHHPNLVLAHDAGEQDGVPFLVTELIDGNDLEALVRAGGPLPATVAVGYIQQAAAGLSCLHGRGVVHRDVKPANLMLDAQGVVKVLDFGIARLDGDDLTGPDLVLGSRRYAAPEAAADERADVYGLGATLTFLLTGRPPTAEPLRPEIPAGLAAVCRRMLAAAPSDRFASVAEASHALAAFSRPRRRAWWWAAGIVVGVACGLAWWLTRPAPTPPAAPAAPDEGFSEERFRRANPRFDGPLDITREGGRVVRLAIVADRVTDLSPLRGLPLTELKLDRLPLRDLSPLHGMPLRKLSLRDAAVADLAPLRGAPLEEIDLTASGVTDLSPLRGMPLDSVDVYATKVSDLTPLAGTRLRRLNCGGTRVASLAPLAGMPLVSLICDMTPVSDLSPLRGAPLEVLRCDRTGVTDLSPLRDAPLQKLWFEVKPARDAATLRAIPTLREINGRPAAEFWAEVGGG